MECNPETVTPELAAGAGGRAACASRSGAQSFQAPLLAVLERRATPAVVEAAVDDPARGRRGEPLARPHPRYPGPGPRAARRRPRPADRAAARPLLGLRARGEARHALHPRATAPSWRGRASCSRSTTSASSSASRAPATPGTRAPTSRGRAASRSTTGPTGWAATTWASASAPSRRVGAERRVNAPRLAGYLTRSRPASPRRPSSRSCPRRRAQRERLMLGLRLAEGVERATVDEAVDPGGARAAGRARRRRGARR